MINYCRFLCEWNVTRLLFSERWSLCVRENSACFFCRKAEEEDEQYFHMLIAGDSAWSMAFLVEKISEHRVIALLETKSYRACLQ